MKHIADILPGALAHLFGGKPAPEPRRPLPRPEPIEPIEYEPTPDEVDE